MRRTFRILLGIVGVVALVLIAARQDSAGPQAKGQLQFKDENGGKGITKDDGNLFSFHTYTSNDGVKLLTYIETCSSGLNAMKALDQKIKQASSIGARGPKLGRDGKPIGERVVLTVEKKAQGEVQSESFICWTTGSKLHWIQSQSLKHALAFEKTLDP
jgi:hypothetical protein